METEEGGLTSRIVSDNSKSSLLILRRGLGWRVLKVLNIEIHLHKNVKGIEILLNKLTKLKFNTIISI